MKDQIIENYQKYKEKEISKLTFKYSQYEKIVEKHRQIGFFKQKIIGKSFEDRNLFLFEAGKGKIKIFAWSQMHGNEPVSTMALLDFMNFLSQNDENNTLRQKFLDSCSFFFLPLVNPDGAQLFTRRNAQDIDLNRDALKLTAPESQILNSTIDLIKPDFAFNMHDQERYYGTENSNSPSVMSFLSPSFDTEKNIDKHRKYAMSVIANIYLKLTKIHAETITKYSDTFILNAFGDNIQKKNISTILFEAGYIIGDNQRQQVRKIYFLALLYAALSISEKKYEQTQISVYHKIPINVKMKFVDFILKDVTIIRKGKKFVTDIAIARDILDTEQFTDTIQNYMIVEIGDLSLKKAFYEINCSDKKQITDNEHKIKRLNNADFLFDYFNIK